MQTEYKQADTQYTHAVRQVKKKRTFPPSDNGARIRRCREQQRPKPKGHGWSQASE